jgi:hypothetical protein
MAPGLDDVAAATVASRVQPGAGCSLRGQLEELMTGNHLCRLQPLILGQAELRFGATGSGDDVDDFAGIDLGECADQMLDQIRPAVV